MFFAISDSLLLNNISQIQDWFAFKVESRLVSKSGPHGKRSIKGVRFVCFDFLLDVLESELVVDLVDAWLIPS